jgi:hypothetical protein
MSWPVVGVSEASLLALLSALFKWSFHKALFSFFFVCRFLFESFAFVFSIADGADSSAQRARRGSCVSLVERGLHTRPGPGLAVR